MDSSVTPGISTLGTLATFGSVLAAVAFSLFFNGNQFYAYEVSATAAILAAAISVWRISGARFVLGLPGIAFACLFAWSALAIGWSEVPYVSVLDLGSLGAGFLLYFAVAAHRHESLPKGIDQFLMALGAALAAAMLCQAMFGFEARAMFLNPNSAAGYLNLMWPLAAMRWLILPAGHAARAVTLASIVLMFVSIGLTGSRGAMLAAVVALAIVVAGACIVLKQHRRAALLVILLPTALFAADFLGGGQVGSGVGTMGDPGSAGASRFTIWSAVWEMIQQRPWLGYGPGVFFLAYPAFRPATDKSAGFFVHNDYLEFWLERGLPGLVLFLLLIVACFATLLQSWIRARRSTEPVSQFTPTIAAAAALSTLAIHGLFSYSLQMMPFVLALGLLIARLEASSIQRPVFSIPTPTVRHRELRVITLSVIVLLGSWQVITHALYFKRTNAGSQHELRGEYAAAADEFSRARALWSLPDSGWYLQANVHYQALRANSDLSIVKRQQLASQAIHLLDEADARNPLQPATPLIRGLFRANFPDLVDGSSTEAFRESLRRNPRTLGARYALSQVMEREGRIEEAIELIGEGLRLRYQDTSETRTLIARLNQLRTRVDEGSAPIADPMSPELQREEPRPGLR